MAWLNAVAELRTALSDGATDRIRYRKRVFGDRNSVNVAFKTFEYRRLTNFTTAVAPMGVYLNGVLVPVSSDDLTITGEFNLATAPGPTDLIEATYYFQWFVDSELDSFLLQAVRWLGLGEDYNSVADGLKPAALRYAMFEAYSKLALRYAERISEIYRLEDAPDPKELAVVGEYQKSADMYLKQAETMRKGYYTRQDQPLAPLYGVIRGRAKEVTPPR